jgi:rhodanese-related sulfurtransferase
LAKRRVPKIPTVFSEVFIMNRASLALSAVLIFVLTPLLAADKAFVPDEGFVSLFDGKSLTGWTGSVNGYAVENGDLICVAGGKGNLLTEKEYGDFVFKFEFKLTPGANNGLGIRCPKVAEGSLHLDGTELQILDDGAEQYKALQPYQYHGSAYGLVPAKQGSLKPVGEWNQQEVTVQGRKLKVVVNGKTIVDADLDEATKSGTLDGQKHPGLDRAKGHLALLGHGDRVDFRHLQIKELPLSHTRDSLDTVKAKLKDKTAVLLDVRETSEWNDGHVEGAVSLPISTLQKGMSVEDLLKIVPKDKVIYTHCFAGRRSLAAAEELSKRGYDVRPLKPGINELLEAGFPKAK